MARNRKGIQIKPNQFTEVMESYLDLIGDEAVSITQNVILNTANYAKDELQKETTGKFKNRTGDYRKDWAVMMRKTNGWKNLPGHGAYATVYNKTNYRLTHLLEYGHAVRRGGRTVGQASEYPHILEVQNKALSVLERELLESLKRMNSAGGY